MTSLSSFVSTLSEARIVPSACFPPYFQLTHVDVRRCHLLISQCSVVLLQRKIQKRKNGPGKKRKEDETEQQGGGGVKGKLIKEPPPKRAVSPPRITKQLSRKKKKPGGLREEARLYNNQPRPPLLDKSARAEGGGAEGTDVYHSLSPPLFLSSGFFPLD